MKNKKQKKYKVVQFPIFNIPLWSISVGWQRAFRFKLYLPNDQWEVKLYSWMISLGNIYIIKWSKD
jgi:hypothetical protein